MKKANKNMKKLNKQSIVIALVVAFVLGLTGVTAFAAGPTTVDLKTAAPFAILAGTPLISDAGNFSTITGNVGLWPGPGSGIGLLCSQVTGTIYARDATGNICFTVNNPLLVMAKSDLTAAYTDAAGRTPVTIVPTELGGQTLGPGVYASDSTFLQITGGADGPGPLILDGQGNPNAVFIFEASDEAAPALVPGSDSVVQLTGQAQACNVFWRVNAATIDTTAVFKGTILAYDSITVANGANIEGRLLAQTGQVTLINDTITVPTCVAGSTTSTTPVVPGLPNTGIASDNKNSTPWSIIIPAGAVVTLSSLYLVRKKRTI